MPPMATSGNLPIAGEHNDSISGHIFVEEMKERLALTSFQLPNAF